MTRPKAPKTDAKPTKARSSRVKTPTTKGKAHQDTLKKSRKKREAVDDSDSDEEDDLLDDLVEAGDKKTGDKTFTIDWSDVTLSEALIARVLENRDIKRALYPPPGPNASTAHGGGKTKVASYWQLCLNLLGDHPKYKDALAAVTTPKEKVAHANKMKNRLRGMAKTTRGHMEAMGETGAGIRSAAEIDTTVTNAFTTKWEEIRSTCPWFFDMRDLIAQRPNLVPAGLGHSGSAFDTDVLSADPTTHEAASSPRDAPAAGDQASVFGDDISSDDDREGHVLTQIDVLDFDSDFPPPHELGNRTSSDGDYLPSEDGTHDAAGGAMANLDHEEKQKAQKGNGKGRTGRTVAQPGISKPAPLPIPTATAKPTKKTKIAEFTEIAKNEEVTHQKELDLAKIRAQSSLKELDIRATHARSKEESRREDKRARREERMAKLRIREMKLQHAHDLRMATLASGSSHAATDHVSHAGRSAGYSSSESRYALSDPDFGGYGSISAGPSSATGSSFDADNFDFSFPSLTPSNMQ